MTISPEAAARIAELGFQTPLEQMIDHACHHLPDVVRVKVALNERYDMGGEPGVAIEAYSRRPFDPDIPPHYARAFPPAAPLSGPNGGGIARVSVSCNTTYPSP